MQWRISALVKTFVSPLASLGELDAQSVATLIATASDIALVIDPDGTIRDIAFQSEELADDLDTSNAWTGRKLMSTVVADSRPKVTHLMADAALHNAKPKWRHINHATSDGRSIPVLYCAVQVGEDGRMVAFGRDLRAMSSLQQRLMTAQESLERDYSRMREVETRYRLLFQMSSEAVLILDTVRHRVVEANPAARALFGARAEQPSGQTLGRDIRRRHAAERAGASQRHTRRRAGRRVPRPPGRDGRGRPGLRLAVPPGERDAVPGAHFGGPQRGGQHAGRQAQAAEAGGKRAGRLRGHRQRRQSS